MPNATEHSSSRKLVLDYITNLAAGGGEDNALEAQSAARLGFDTLDLAKVIFALVTARNLSPDTVAQRMGRATTEPPRAEHVDDRGGWSSFTGLFMRVVGTTKLVSDDASEGLLRAGLIGPGNEVGPYHESVTIGFIVRYCQEVLDLPIRRKGGAKPAAPMPQSRVPPISPMDAKRKTIWPRVGLVVLAIAVVCVLVILLR